MPPHPLLSAVFVLLLAATSSCGGATCEEACDNLYACLDDTSTPRSECVARCESDPGKGDPDNVECVADASCQELQEGRCPDLIVR